MAGARTTTRRKKLTFTRGMAARDRRSNVMWCEVIREGSLGRGDIINLTLPGESEPVEMVYLGACSNGRKYLREIVELEQEYSIAA